MTDAEARALGERAINTGALTFDPPVRGGPLDSPPVPESERDPAGILWRRTGSMWWPDLRDPATRGAALDVVRERWREPSYSLTAVDESCHPIRWEWVDGGLAAPMLDHKIGYQQFDSEAAALVAALEAAPKGER